MSIEVGNKVIYRWNNAREAELENIADWTGAGRAVNRVTDDVYRLAVAYAPVGRARTDQTQRIKTSHYKGGRSFGKGFTGFLRMRRAVGNRAPHAVYVHEGTLHLGRFPVFAKAKWMGVVPYGENGLTRVEPGVGELRGHPYASAMYYANPDGAIFHHFLFRGQRKNPWLERAGRAAYAMPRNH